MIIIEKAKRQLIRISADGAETMRVKIALGAQPEGAKRLEGDGRTPEGEYRVCTINKRSKYHIALGINYPRARDARRALARGDIGAWDFTRVLLADAFRLRPPWHTPLGGYIMLHGEGADKREGDWTAGCVALKNEDIERLSKALSKGERVRILP